MARKSRLNLPGVPQHVVQRGNNRQPCFLRDCVISPEYCIACYRYIEMNPVRAGLVSHPGNYPWSSYRVTGMGANSKLISPHDTWLGLGKCNEERTQMYRSLVGLPLDEGVLSEIRSGFAKGNSLGLKEGKKDRGQVR